MNLRVNIQSQIGYTKIGEWKVKERKKIISYYSNSDVFSINFLMETISNA